MKNVFAAVGVLLGMGLCHVETPCVAQRSTRAASGSRGSDARRTGQVVSGRSPSADTLLTRATRVPIGKWATYRKYFWLSDHQVLLFREAPSILPRKRVFVSHDLLTRHDTVLIRLTELYSRTSVSDEIAVSPDGQWLLWTDDEFMMYAARLNGTGHFLWKVANSYHPVLWTPDSERVVSIYLSHWGDSVTSRSVRPPHQPIRLNVDLDRVSGLSGGDHAAIVAGNRLLAWDPNGREDPVSSLKVWIVPMRGRKPRVTSYRIRLPFAAMIQEAYPAPSGDRLALMLARQAKGVQARSIWVGGIDGRGMTRIGETKSGPSKADGPCDLAWVPGGKRLSFVYDDEIWTVPASR